MKRRRALAPWVITVPIVAVPPLLMPPQVLAAEVVMLVAVGLCALRPRVAPLYGKPVWWCRVKLGWWGWRAQRRQRADRRRCV